MAQLPPLAQLGSVWFSLPQFYIPSSSFNSLPSPHSLQLGHKPLYYTMLIAVIFAWQIDSSIWGEPEIVMIVMKGYEDEYWSCC